MTNIRNQVAKGDLELAIDQAIHLGHSLDELALLSGQLTTARSRWRMDLLTFEQLKREENRIAFALLKLLDDHADTEGASPTPGKQHITISGGTVYIAGDDISGK